MVSHELPIKLAAIREFAATMLDVSSGLDPAEVHQFHRIIVEQTERMRELIGDLLDVAHIETGSLSVSPEPSDVAALAGTTSGEPPPILRHLPLASVGPAE